MKLSVLIPFYKGNSVINETLSSIEKNLGFDDYEVIIINDSPDEPIILNKIFKNTKIISNSKNLGIATSRNKAFEQSKGEYILFLDQDDLISDNNIIGDLLDLNYKAYIFNFEEFDGQIIRRFYRYSTFNFLNNYDEKKILKHGPLFRTVSQFLVRRELFEPFIYSEAQGSDDFFYYCDIYKKTKRNERLFIKIPQIKYRIHESNYTKKADFYLSLNQVFNEYNRRNGFAYNGLNRFYMSKSIFWRISHKIEMFFFCK